MKSKMTAVAIICFVGFLHTTLSQEWHFAGVNIARDKATTQMPEGVMFPAGLAVDGDNKTCSETGTIDQNEGNLTVFLGGMFQLKGIRIYNRENLEYRLANFTIVGGPVSETLYQDSIDDQYNSPRVDVPISSSMNFSEVTIRIPANSGDDGNWTLSLCEVEIYSVSNDCRTTDIDSTVLWEIAAGTGYNNNSGDIVSSGSVLLFRCASEYKLTGEPDVTCLVNGSYSSELPRCLRQCNESLYIQNGQYMDTSMDYVVGDTINWTCSVGYSSEDNTTRVCQQDGTWSGQDPVCSLMTCLYPGNVTNGNLTFDNGTDYATGDATYGTMVRILCDVGFGSDTSSIECNADGLWTESPTCMPVECPSLGDAVGGYYEYEVNGEIVPDPNIYYFGYQARLLCNETLYRNPSDEVGFCALDGNWAGIPGQCVPLCPSPSTISNGYYYPNSTEIDMTYDAGMFLTPECDIGFMFSDASMAGQARTCQPNHTWSGLDPSCVAVTCITQAVLSNGMLLQNGIVVQQGKFGVEEIITVACEQGFEPNTPTITCQATGMWDYDPFCTQVKCPALGTLQGGQYHYTLSDSIVANSMTYLYGTEVSATCEGPLFRLSSDVPRICEQDHAWHGQEIVCIPQCPTPSLDNGNYRNNDGSADYYDRGEILFPVCQTGYELDQQTRALVDRSIICMDNHSWDGSDPRCEIIRCSVGSLHAAENFYEVDGGHDSVTFNSAMTASCLAGYERLRGDIMRTCREDKSFSGTELICTGVEAASVVGPAVGGTIGALIALALIAALIYCFLFRHRKSIRPNDPLNVHVEYSKRSGVESVHSRNYSMLLEPPKDIATNHTALVDETAPVALEPKDTVIMANSQTRPRSVMDMNALVDFILAADYRDKSYTVEFESLNKDLVKPYTAALANPTKNRYPNVLPYDETRVKLDVWDAETETDYINANFIVGYTNPQAYIACQGPTEETFGDFWRMVWQQECGVIIMLTNLEEDGKVQCGQYWPSEGSKAYGKLTVTLKSEDAFANFLVRTFSLSKDGEVTEREVQQYHFTTWPEKECPNVSMRVLNLCNKANKKEQTAQGPMVIHCSDGAGRTGTFIAIDYLSEQSLEEGTAVVADCVRSMRDTRPGMVQTKEQYIFIHQALMEAFVLNTFEVASEDFSEVYKAMLEIDPLRGKPKIDIDFENLQKIKKEPPVGETKHTRKNRKPDNIPSAELMPSTKQPGLTTGEDDYINTVVMRNLQKIKKEPPVGETKHTEMNRKSDNIPSAELMPSTYQPGLTTGEDDYINAVFMPTYRQQNGMIIAQSPLEATKEDFWGLVFHQRVATIVMMHEASALSEKEVYWPSVNETIKFGDLEVAHKECTEKDGHVVLSLGLKRGEEERIVSLVQFGAWKAGEQVPAEHKTMLSLITLVTEKQTEANGAPILVHCMDGAEMSGLFCVVWTVLEREHVEDTVAVPQVIQEVRIRRAHAIPNLEQFRYCYDVVLEYLQNKKHYRL